jgi:hypothetical protein
MDFWFDLFAPSVLIVALSLGFDSFKNQFATSID